MKQLALPFVCSLVLTSCAGSPDIMIVKNIYIIDSENVEVNYSTESAVKSAAEIAQDLKSDVKVTPGP